MPKRKVSVGFFFFPLCHQAHFTVVFPALCIWGENSGARFSVEAGEVMPKFLGGKRLFVRSPLRCISTRPRRVCETFPPNTICHLLHHTCAVCSSQWPFLWSFSMPLPSPPCALVNVRRTRRMDGCVKSRRRCARWSFLPGLLFINVAHVWDLSIPG